MNKITRLFDFPYHQQEKYSIPDSLVTKYNGEWVKTSTDEYISKANAISRALLRMGIQKDKYSHKRFNRRNRYIEIIFLKLYLEFEY